MQIELKPLADQVVVITGASSGIGLVTARLAAARGARVFLIARDEQALAEVVDGIGAAGGVAAHAAADVGDIDQLRHAADAAVAAFGRIDSWVSNAGVAIYAGLLDTPLDDHWQLIRTNYFGTVHSAMTAVPHLRAAGGALITVASVASDIPSPGMGAYAASKHAVQGYVRALRAELGAERAPVSVTLIKPSGIDTPIGQHALNRLGGEAQIPPPVYDPSLVAEAILDAATHRRTDITVGGAGRAQALFAEHFPALFERLAPLAAKAFTDDDKVQPGPSNLFAPQRNGRERSGEQPGRRRTSLYTVAQRHPGVMLSAVGLTIGSGLLALARERR